MRRIDAGLAAIEPLLRRLLRVRAVIVVTEVTLVALEIDARARGVLCAPQLQLSLRIAGRVDERREPRSLIIGEALEKIHQRLLLELVDDLRAFVGRHLEQKVERANRLLSRRHRSRFEQALDLEPIGARLQIGLAGKRRRIGRRPESHVGCAGHRIVWKPGDRRRDHAAIGEGRAAHAGAGLVHPFVLALNRACRRLGVRCPRRITHGPMISQSAVNRTTSSFRFSPAPPTMAP